MTAAIPCNDCGGQGQKVETTQGANGATITTQRTCTRCNGQGVVG